MRNYLLYINQNCCRMMNIMKNLNYSALLSLKPVLTICITINILLTLFTCHSSIKIPPVPELNIDKYSGTWYEIARYDHFFERGMDNVTAEYTLNSDGSVQVINRGIKSGVIKSITGKAYRKTENENGILKVVFFIIGSEYRVIYLDKEYRYAVVTSDTPDYLWILARSPKIDPEKLKELVSFISANGFKSEKLIFVKHD